LAWNFCALIENLRIIIRRFRVVILIFLRKPPETIYLFSKKRRECGKKLIMDFSGPPLALPVQLGAAHLALYFKNLRNEENYERNFL
jgi:hypothetical protein